MKKGSLALFMCAVITVLSVIPSLGTQAAEELSLTLDYGECEDVLVSLFTWRTFLRI